jgi:hypothetical protein
MSRILARAFGPIPPRANGVGEGEVLDIGLVEAALGAGLLSRSVIVSPELALIEAAAVIEPFARAHPREFFIRDFAIFSLRDPGIDLGSGLAHIFGRQIFALVRHRRDFDASSCGAGWR